MLLANGVEVAPRATVGIGVASDGDDLATLLDRADQAMYRAKARGKNAVELIDPQHAGMNGRSAELANQLALDVPLDQCTMAYQPVIDTESGAIVSIEALLRWTHPVHGVLGPDDFLVGLTDGAAAETIDEFVLRSTSDALDQTARFPDVSIAINLGLTQLSRDSFAEVVRRQTAPVHLGRLVLEIPVRALRRSPEAVIRRVDTLRQLGVAVSLDDFELDDVPFQLLADVRPSIVKLARTTVGGLSDSAVMPVVRALAELGGVYGFQLVLAATGSQPVTAANRPVSVIVTAEPGHVAGAVDAVARVKGKVTRRLDIVGGVAATVDQRDLASLRRLPFIRSVTPNAVVRPLSQAWNPYTDIGGPKNVSEIIGSSA